MLVTVGGLMATIIFPGKTVPTLVVTATLSAASAIRRSMKQRRQQRPSSGNDGDAINGRVVEADAQAVTLQWSNVSCVLSKKKSDEKRIILKNASGLARPGRVMAIMGPSGSGKTTLLNILAGRVQKSSSISIYGKVSINEQQMSSGSPSSSLDEDESNANGKGISVPIAYVAQEDLFFNQLTVRETLDIAARLRLNDAKNDQNDALIRKLGLLSCADATVGDEKQRGISGGEKKRLSLGIELISTPKLIVCDEPTTGLDAFQAERVMRTLRSLAEAGHTVICSIHQPSSSIFSLFDDIILLSEGKQVYSGPADETQDHFTKAGHPPPTNQFNPAERYLELISIDYSSDETVAESRARIEKLAAHAESAKSPNGEMKMSTASSSSHQGNVVASRRNGPFRQIRVLLSRAWKQTTRDKKTNISRFMSTFMSALLFGGMYWKLGLAQNTIQDRLGLLQVCSINTAMTSLVKTLNVFPREGTLVNRERVRGTYNIFEYLTSKLFAELPVGAFFPLVFSSIVYPMARLSGGLSKLAKFLGIVTLESFTAASYGLAIGALVPSTDAALAVGPSTFILQVVFGGLYISDQSVPKWAAWIPKISIIKHAFQALCINELSGLKFETEAESDAKTGEQILKRFGWDSTSVAKCCASQARVLAFNYLLTYTILNMKKPRFERLKPPMDDNPPEIVELADAQDGGEAAVRA